MENVKDILKKKTVKQVNSIPVNRYKKDETTVNSITVTDKITAFLEEQNITPEGVAKTLAEKLDDAKSIDYYTILATETSQTILLEALSHTLNADRKGKIRTKKAIYFLAILKRWKIKVKFKADR